LKKRIYVRASEPPFSQPLASEYQNFTSPGYPGYYPKNVECVWLFKVPSRRRRLLTVEFVDLNLAEGCDDHIQVRFVSRRKNPVKTKSKSRPDRRIKRRILETKLCGSAVPVKYKSTRLAHLVEITFKADSIHSSKGFRAIFRGFSKTTIRDVPFDPNDVHNSGIQICSLSSTPRDGDSNSKNLALSILYSIINKNIKRLKVSTVKALNQVLHELQF
jgi:hypothetical protein